MHDDASIERALTHMDVVAKERAGVESMIHSRKVNIRQMKQEITRISRRIRQENEAAATEEVTLAAMPKATMTKDDVIAKLREVANLPWVEKVTLSNDTRLTIKTRANTLKTTFFNRVVYKGGVRVRELLPRPLTLPMPEYELNVDLRNMGSGWHRSPSLLLRLANPSILTHHPKDVANLGYSFAAYAHWASHESPPYMGGSNSAANYSDLCLQDYRGQLSNAGNTSIVDFLNEVSIFLQESGWAHAFRQKEEWMCTLGFQPYVEQLMRPLADGETFESIQATTRERMAGFLSENRLTQHTYDYGSAADGEVIPEPPMPTDYFGLQEAILRGPMTGGFSYTRMPETLRIIDSFIQDEIEVSDDPTPF